MADDKSDPGEFSIGRGRDKGANANSFEKHGASRTPPGQGETAQAEFDLGGASQRHSESGIPERLRRKYYVAEAGAGDEARVYADPRGEYLAFKVTSERMATRLEDAGVVRDMVSIAQHRGWKEVELRGSEEFRRTAWLEASVRGLSVRGYEPDPVDRAALSFRTTGPAQSSGQRQARPSRDARASETLIVDGVQTKRPIDVTVLPPEAPSARFATTHDRPDMTAARSWGAGTEMAAAIDRRRQVKSSERPDITIEVVASEAHVPHRPERDQWQARADGFRSGDKKENSDDAVKSARSQLAAIQRALAKAVRDPILRQSVLRFARERIAEELERGGTFERMQVTQKIQSRQKTAPVPENTKFLRNMANRRTPDIER